MFRYVIVGLGIIFLEVIIGVFLYGHHLVRTTGQIHWLGSDVAGYSIAALFLAVGLFFIRFLHSLMWAVYDEVSETSGASLIMNKLRFKRANALMGGALLLFLGVTVFQGLSTSHSLFLTYILLFAKFIGLMMFVYPLMKVVKSMRKSLDDRKAVLDKEFARITGERA